MNSGITMWWMSVLIILCLDHIHHTQKHIEAELALIVQNTAR